MTNINLQLFFPWGMLLQWMRTTIVFCFVHTLLKHKVNAVVTYLSMIAITWIFGYLSLKLANQTNEMLFALAYYLLIYCIIVLCTQGKILVKMGSIVCAWAAMIASSIISMFCFPLLGIKSEVFIQYDPPFGSFLAYLLFMFSSSFLWVALIKFIKNKILRKTALHAKNGLFLFFPFSHILTAIICTRYFQMMSENLFQGVNSNSEYFIFFFIVCCILFDFLMLLLTNQIDSAIDNNINLEKELSKNQLYYQQIVQLNKEKKEFRKLKHDFSNILTTAQGYIEIGKPEKALAILSNTYTDLTGLSGFSVCSNETVNTILYIKTEQAKDANVRLITEVVEECKVWPDDYDVCRLLSNIIDNALNTAARIDKNRSVFLRIEITETSIRISSENHFVPSTTTIRKKDDSHGYGTSIIREITKKYDGSYTAHFEDDIYYTETVLGNKTEKPIK